MSGPVIAAMEIDNWSIWTNGLFRFVYFILLLLALLGNVLVIMTIRANKRLHLGARYSIASQALTDLLMAIGPIPLAPPCMPISGTGRLLIKRGVLCGSDQVYYW
ncbi:hypothetical protein FGIG_09729 [Fasciola gigantica]|uniref:G-protein coupled receptors family 1 profile domain-containing protein n=1 Tax=Fasciola gigantica TaxID=46835 RepID=A0A504Y883_FASGI|nr:hypothetical protein FGIG_09729 [Fasciola gigantica]